MAKVTGDDPRVWLGRRRARALIQALSKNGFTAHYVDTGEEARDLALRVIPEGASVGIGGSVTIRELGLPQALASRGNTLFDHWDPSLDPAQKKEARDRQILADVFLSSSNAVTEGGFLVNIDGTGNRVAAMMFGPKMSIVIAGFNKIVRDTEAGLLRIRNDVAPANSKRLGQERPCADGLSCDECGPPRACAITSVLEAKPGAKEEFVVIIVGEELGY